MWRLAYLSYLVRFVGVRLVAVVSFSVSYSSGSSMSSTAHSGHPMTWSFGPI